MAKNYAKELSRDAQGGTFVESPPAFPTLQSQSGVPLSSSVLSLSTGTTVVEVSALSNASGAGGILLKWGVASVTATNFDSFVQAGTTRLLVVPVSVIGNSSSVQGANSANGLYNAVALKTANGQSTSVFTSEY